MLGIQVNGQFLQLAPGSTAQLQRNNPFLTKDKIDGEYSLPVSINYTETNCEALGFVFNYYNRRQKTTIDAVLYDGTAMAYRGQLVLETMNTNINSPQSAVIGGYFLTGASQFIYEVKDTLLKNVNLGTRSFTWTTDNHTDNSNGFWQHVHATWTQSNFGYVFYPVRNEGWQGEGGTVDMMNKMDRSVAYARLSVTDNRTSLCPHLYLSFVLQRLFEAYGYTLTGNVLQDPDFQKLTIVSFRSIDWITPSSNIPRNVISFRIADHLPPKWKITDLIIELQQYLAITFIIDPLTRTIELTALKEIPTTTRRKDWTQYAGPALQSKFENAAQKYSLVTTVDSGDSLPGSAIDLENKTVLPPVESHANLYSIASAGTVGSYVYCQRDNTWYVGITETYQSGGNKHTRYTWSPTNYNIFSYQPTGSTESFENRVSTLATMYTLEQFSGSAANWVRLYPGCNQEGAWSGRIGKEVDWNLRLLFYRGMAVDKLLLDTPPTQTLDSNGIYYPYATATQGGPLDSAFIPNGVWALPYIYTNPLNGFESGTYHYWWKQWLDCLEAAGEVTTWQLWLPRYELQQHRWTDVILIRNVPYLAQSFTEDLPYPGFVQAELRRIG